MVHQWCTHLALSHRHREVDVPLHTPADCLVSAVHDPSPDTNPMPDTPLLPAGSSDSPALSSTYNGQPPAILLSGQDSEATGSSSGLPEAESSHVGLASSTSLPSSRFPGVMEVPSSGMNHSPPFHLRNIQFGHDCDIATGGGATMSGDSNSRQGEITAELALAVDFSRHPDSSSPGVQRVTDVTLTKSHRSERRVSCSSPPRDLPEIRTSHVDTYPLSGHIDPQSSALAHENLSQHPCQPVTTSEPTNSTTSCAASLCHGNKGQHHHPFPQPPPEVATLLMAESSGDVLSPVFARNSPLVPWDLPSEIGHFWSGLFKISEVKVTRTCHTIRHLISLSLPGRNEFTTKSSGYNHSPACLAFLSGMGGWRRGSTPG